jgi:hypothetical protein
MAGAALLGRLVARADADPHADAYADHVGHFRRGHGEAVWQAGYLVAAAAHLASLPPGKSFRSTRERPAAESRAGSDRRNARWFALLIRFAVGVVALELRSRS